MFMHYYNPFSQLNKLSNLLRYVALDIIGLISEDSGTYTCRASNNVGTDECQVSLSCKSEFINIEFEADWYTYIIKADA